MARRHSLALRWRSRNDEISNFWASLRASELGQPSSLLVAHNTYGIRLAPRASNIALTRDAKMIPVRILSHEPSVLNNFLHGRIPNPPDPSFEFESQAPIKMPTFCGHFNWCRRWDSNSQLLRDMLLRHARIPIPPRRHISCLFILNYINGFAVYVINRSVEMKINFHFFLAHNYKHKSKNSQNTWVFTVLAIFL